MTESQLLYFTTIVELGSFSEAALSLDISQSSISKQIMQLEGELGLRLFDRSFRKARLTAAGEHLYQDAVLALKQISHMKDVANQLALSGRRRISLLALPVIGHANPEPEGAADDLPAPDYISIPQTLSSGGDAFLSKGEDDAAGRS